MGGYLPSSVFGVIIAGRGRLSTVPFVRFIQQRGGTALYRPLCSVYIAGGRGQLSTVPCVRFYIGIAWRFGEGTVSDAPPPVGSVEVEYLECGAEKK